MTLQAGFLPRLGLLRFEGPDAATFLQGQLTQDTRRLEAGRWLPAALCSPQGRVLATLRLARLGSGIVAVLPQELAPVVRERLQRYVLRAKVRIELPEAAGVQAGGVLAGTSEALIEGLPGCPAEAGQAALDGELAILRLAGPRALLVGPSSALAARIGGAQALADEAWTAAAIHAGDPEVGGATSEHWIPQMLNLDLTGAVSFSKGCYTGQEIVTRTQHLGRIKRRTLAYRTPAALSPEPAAALYRGDEKVGEVVLAAPDAGETRLLAVVNLADAGMALGSAPGIADLLPQPLPYVIPELNTPA
ncbi:MAG: folate-binding protein YgfZ [Gammaproteobacteria bacterium]|nr:folate-binding protein YgfZ [Gammaproteobacteria bacterium]